MEILTWWVVEGHSCTSHISQHWTDKRVVVLVDQYLRCAEALAQQSFIEDLLVIKMHELLFACCQVVILALGGTARTHPMVAEAKKIHSEADNKVDLIRLRNINILDHCEAIIEDVHWQLVNVGPAIQ